VIKRINIFRIATILFRKTINAPIMAENMHEFYLGSRENLNIQITRPGDAQRGILDYGIVKG
jgi:hypothetical protein